MSSNILNIWSSLRSGNRQSDKNGSANEIKAAVAKLTTVTKKTTATATKTLPPQYAPPFVCIRALTTPATDTIRLVRKRPNTDLVVHKENYDCSPKKVPRIQQPTNSFEIINVSDEESDLVESPKPRFNSFQRNPLRMNQNSNRIARKKNGLSAAVDDAVACASASAAAADDDDTDVVVIKAPETITESTMSVFDRVKNSTDHEAGRNRKRVETYLATLKKTAAPFSWPSKFPDSSRWWPMSTKNSHNEKFDFKVYRNQICEFTRNFFQKTSKTKDYLNQKPIATIDLTAETEEDAAAENVCAPSEQKALCTKTEAEKQADKGVQLTNALRRKSLDQRAEITLDAAYKESDLRFHRNHNLQMWSTALENDLVRLTIKKMPFIDDLVPLSIADDEDEVVEIPALPEIPEKKRETVVSIFRGFNDKEVIVKQDNDTITRHDLKTLQPRGWLNDEIINFYLNLIRKRNETKRLRSVHTMNTFFLIRYRSSGYSSVRRWTKNVDIFAKDFFIVPVHLGCHWCMITVDMSKKQCFFYDSMLVARDEFVQLIRQYLIEEHRNKKQSELDVAEWTFTQNFDIPKQSNSWDCGVFSCTFAEFVTRNLPLQSTSFCESDMDYFRMKMAAEILDGELFT